MRKQTKIAAVVSAAALLALGASMTSFAASKGTWMMVDGEWYCYDKNGDAYEDKFCSSNGKEYYVGEDGQHYFIVKKNGSIQHSCVKYKEDSDVLIDASDLAKTAFSTTEGLYKYSIDAATASAINKVDMIDETEVMH